VHYRRRNAQRVDKFIMICAQVRMMMAEQTTAFKQHFVVTGRTRTSSQAIYYHSGDGRRQQANDCINNL